MTLRVRVFLHPSWTLPCCHHTQFVVSNVRAARRHGRALRAVRGHIEVSAISVSLRLHCIAWAGSQGQGWGRDSLMRVPSHYHQQRGQRGVEPGGRHRFSLSKAPVSSLHLPAGTPRSLCLSPTRTFKWQWFLFLLDLTQED